MAAGVRTEDAGRGEALPDLGAQDGEGQARGTGAVVHDEEGSLAHGGSEIGVVDGGGGTGFAVLRGREEELTLEVRCPWDLLKCPPPLVAAGRESSASAFELIYERLHRIGIMRVLLPLWPCEELLARRWNDGPRRRGRRGGGRIIVWELG